MMNSPVCSTYVERITCSRHAQQGCAALTASRHHLLLLTVRMQSAGTSRTSRAIWCWTTRSCSSSSSKEGFRRQQSRQQSASLAAFLAASSLRPAALKHQTELIMQCISCLLNPLVD